MRSHLKKSALVVLGLLAMATTQASTNDSCLMLDTTPTTGILDVHAGTYTEIPNLPNSEIPRGQSFVQSIDGLSPDRLRFANLVSDGNTSFAIKVKQFKEPLPLGQRGSLISHIGSSDEVFWSPNGQWIFYIRRGSSDNTWGIADKHGNKLYENSVPKYDKLLNKGYELQFGRWSPDSQYLALIELAGWTGSKNLVFFSVSQLRNIDSVHTEGCQSLGNDSYDYFSCVKWIEGHQVAYVTGNQQNPELTITTLGSTHKTIYKLPIASGQYQTFYQIVPGELYVAVTTPTSDGIEIDGYGVNNEKQFRVDASDISNLDSLAADRKVVPDTTLTWTPGGETLIYARYTDKNLKTVEIIGYNIDTGNKRILFTSDETFELALYPSSDNKSVVIAQNFNIYRGSLDGEWKSHFLTSNEEPLGLVAWSIDESLLAVANYDLDKTTGDISSTFVDIYNSDGIQIIHKKIPANYPIRDMLWTTCPKP